MTLYSPGAAAATETRIDHVVLTRFNLPTPGPESLVRAQDGWLRNRAALFERYTVPAMLAQTVCDFTWLVYLDPASPPWLLDRMRPLVDEGVFTPVFRETADWHDVVADARTVTGATGGLFVTTNLDNDDAVARDFIARIQAASRRHVGSAIYLSTGLIVEGGRLYRRADPENAFCSVSESWHEPRTAWRDWHNRLHTHFPVVSIGGPPAWLQVVHGQNVSNRVRGTLDDPLDHRRAFPNLLDDASSPSRSARAADRLVRRPLREVRDVLRIAAKTVLLRLAGKDGLDRTKSLIRRLRLGGRPQAGATSR